MKRLRNTIICLLLLSALHSCNGDVFVEDIRPSATSVELDGNGDTFTIHFKSADWEIISGECSLQNAFFHIYNVEGVNIGSYGTPTMSGLGKAVLNDELIALTIERKQAKELTIQVDENLMRDRFGLALLVGNEYESQVIEIIISPCDRYVLDNISYSLDAYQYYGNGVESGMPIAINNTKASTPLTITLHPFERAYNEVKFLTSSSQIFSLFAENTAVDIPTIINASLVMNGARAPFVLGEQRLPIPFANEEKKVTIPAHAHQRITPIVSYDWFETDFTLRAHNPKTNRQRTFTGKLQSNMPTTEFFFIRETITE